MQSKGFFASLFDISFSSLITTKIVKLVYVLSLIAAAVWAVIFTVAAFQVIMPVCPHDHHTTNISRRPHGDQRPAETPIPKG